jgi:carbohydrate-selective porin OprB
LNRKPFGESHPIDGLVYRRKHAFPFETLTFCAGTPGNLAGYSQFNWPVSQWATDLKIYVSNPNSGYGVQSNEFIGEVFYSFDVYHGANIQADFHYIINPGGYTRATNQVIFGVQLNVPL